MASTADNPNAADWTVDRFVRDSVDDAAVVTRGYTAADAAHMFQDFLEERLSLEGFWEWLQRYPYAPDGPAPVEVEDEINRATLALRALREGRRHWEEIRRDIMDGRRRLTGMAWRP